MTISEKSVPASMAARAEDPRRAIRRLNLVGFGVVGLLVFGVGGWAAMTELAGAVIASGNVVVESNVKKVQHPHGGIIGEIYVRDGSHVEEGQLLVRLDDTVPKSTLGVVRSQLDELLARQSRLVAERDGADEVTFPADLLKRTVETPVATAVTGERILFESRRTARTGQRSQLRERIAQVNEEIRGLTAQLAGKEDEIKFLSKELAGAKDLYEKNLTTIMRYTQLQRDQARLQGERGQLIADIARSRGKISETELQIIQVDSDFRTDLLKDLREAEGKIAELKERAIAAEDQLKRVDIRAPQAGIVYQLAVHTIGGVIKEGETIMEVVPRADSLVVQAKVAPHDIDQVAIGAEASVRIMAGNQRITPNINGTVFDVSPDLTRDPPQAGQPASQAQPYYQVRIRLPQSEIERLGELRLMPGMPTETFIRTQERTALQYLLKPLHEQFARTFRER